MKSHALNVNKSVNTKHVNQRNKIIKDPKIPEKMGINPLLIEYLVHLKVLILVIMF